MHLKTPLAAENGRGGGAVVRGRLASQRLVQCRSVLKVPPQWAEGALAETEGKQELSTQLAVERLS